MAEEPKQTVSGETYRAMQQQQSPRRTITVSRSLLASLLVLCVLCGLSFFAGSAYQKHQAKATNVSSSGANHTFGGRLGGGRINGSLGSVTAISSSSISVNDTRSGSTKTYSITSSTQINNNGSTASSSDIKVGDQVLVSASSSSSTTASRIFLNPSFGGGIDPGGQDSGSSSSDSSTTPLN